MMLCNLLFLYLMLYVIPMLSGMFVDQIGSAPEKLRATEI